MITQKNKAVESETNDEVPIDTRRELLGKELMAWNIKALPHSTFGMDVGMAIGGMIPFSFMLYGYFGEQRDTFLQGQGFFGVCVVFFLWKMAVRQKYVYQYRITDQGGEVRYWADFPKGVGTFFKWLSGIFLFVIVCAIAVEPAFIWLLAGPLEWLLPGQSSSLAGKIRKNTGFLNGTITNM